MAKALNNCKVLITGGFGYLGARIGENLATEGYDVYLGSRNPNSYNISSICSQINTNWEDPDLAFCKDFDLIVHAAGMNAQSCLDNPEKALKINGKLSEKLIKKAAQYGCKRFFFLSTVHVYKSPLIGDFDESTQTLNNHPYASSQVYGEQALIKAIVDKKIKGAVLRLSNCFGPPLTDSAECWNLVLNDFIKSAYLNGKILINGNYLSKRDFLPITELNRILIKIFEYQDIPRDIINISTGSSRTLMEVAIKIRDEFSKIKEISIELANEVKSQADSALTIKNSSLEIMNIYPLDELEFEINQMINYLDLASHIEQKF
ncbi:SDR family oxidoreductase [Gammaproteobacteria bacterium]|nr:SDR family oxidoreductase [Gammaproteobacteria bacterium]